jgi:hypothetical protein
MNKYYNRHVRTSDGIVHDSQREANRWIELKLLERAGQIKNLNRQVKFVLIPKQVEYIGKKVKVLERECSYIADFIYQEGGQTVVEDTKGVRTKDYIIKRKLMLYIHGIKIREV